MFLGLQESNVMGCSKHFPGHGNTSVDSHYGLPTITTSMDELYQTELAPFVSAVANGIDSIMTTHIIFTAIDKDYPATLSKKVLTDLLREELGFTGLIITDGMEMDAVSKNFGSYEKTAVMAIKAGVDILTYTTTANPAKAHTGIINAIKNGELTEERINESVRRILLKKLKYDILDNYQAQDKDISEMLKENEELNLKFAMESLTLAKGEFNGLDKNKKTLIISPTTSYSLGNGLESNSMANYTANYLISKGHLNVSHMTVSNNISSTDASNILKPYLARGKISVIGATTKEEYVKYIQNDKALERRFQKIYVNELSLEQTEDILLGLKDIYECFHNVVINNSVIKEIVNLCNKYISYGRLPDKAIDLFDEACACASLQIDDEDKKAHDYMIQIKKIKDMEIFFHISFLPSLLHIPHTE